MNNIQEISNNIKKNKTIDIYSFLKECKTGDILLYSSTNIFAKTIEYFTSSKFSHIAIILKNPVFYDPKLRGTYILESGYEKIPDAESGKFVYGVQIIPIEYVINSYQNGYKGTLYYRKLKCERDELFYKRLRNCIHKVEHVKYDYNIIDWLKAEFNLQFGDCRRTDKFWCSALAAYTLYCLDFVEKDIKWTIIPPKSFSYYECKESPDYKLEYNNCKYEPEKEIDFRIQEHEKIEILEFKFQEEIEEEFQSDMKKKLDTISNNKKKDIELQDI